jgi:hypothetical protein
MHVILVEPAFPSYQRQFVRGLKEAGAYVTGIGERPIAWLDDDLKSWLDAYEQVGSVCDEGTLLRTVKAVQARGWVSRLEATVEAHMLPVARVREACTIPGLTWEQAVLCRDKPKQKEFLRRHGIPCAQSIGAASAAEVRDFVDAVGFPVILKPRAGAGAAGTVRANNPTELQRAIAESGVEQGHSIAVEEFNEGHEGFYDTMTVNGEVTYEFISHYYPNVLPAMRTRNVNPVIVATNRVDSPSYDEVKRMGRKVVAALGLGTCATHMEWFYGPKGLRFSEIGARPPGVGQWDLYCAGNDLDLYREWGNAITHGKVSKSPSRRFATGIVNLRPNRDGVISGYEGLDKARELLGPALMDFHLPNPGTGTQPVSAGYMANAWLRARHPDYDELKRLLTLVGELITVHAGR